MDAQTIASVYTFMSCWSHKCVCCHFANIASRLKLLLVSCSINDLQKWWSATINTNNQPWFHCYQRKTKGNISVQPTWQDKRQIDELKFPKLENKLWHEKTNLYHKFSFSQLRTTLYYTADTDHSFSIAALKQSAAGSYLKWLNRFSKPATLLSLCSRMTVSLLSHRMHLGENHHKKEDKFNHNVYATLRWVSNRFLNHRTIHFLYDLHCRADCGETLAIAGKVPNTNKCLKSIIISVHIGHAQ